MGTCAPSVNNALFGEDTVHKHAAYNVKVMDMTGVEAWVEAGVALFLALIGSLIAYSKSAGRADAKFEEIDRLLRERREEMDTRERERRELIDKEIRGIRYDMNRDNTRFETLISEFRQAIAALYNDKGDIKVDMATNYLSKVDFHSSLERMSLQTNAYQINMDQRLNRLEERLK